LLRVQVCAKQLTESAPSWVVAVLAVKWPELTSKMAAELEDSPIGCAATNREALELIYESHANLPPSLMKALRHAQRNSQTASNFAWSCARIRVPKRLRGRLVEFAEYCQGIMPQEQVVDLICSM
jgi:hypothetical protein